MSAWDNNGPYVETGNSYTGGNMAGIFVADLVDEVGIYRTIGSHHYDVKYGVRPYVFGGHWSNGYEVGLFRWWYGPVTFSVDVSSLRRTGFRVCRSRITYTIGEYSRADFVIGFAANN